MLMKISSEGIKHDGGKPRVGFLLRSFPNAIQAAAMQNQFGAAKYDEMNWKNVHPDRYEDALSRHLIQSFTDYSSLDESGQFHLAAVIWNALALYEHKYNISKNEAK